MYLWYISHKIKRQQLGIREMITVPDSDPLSHARYFPYVIAFIMIIYQRRYYYAHFTGFCQKPLKAL